MIKLIIFDYDGVIADSFSTVYEVYKTIRDELDVVLPDTIEEFRKVYGYDFHECYRNLGMSPDKQKKAAEIFRREIITKEPIIFDGIKEVLSWASKHYTVTLVSSNYTDEVLKKLKNYGVDTYFSMLVGQEYKACEIDKSKEFTTILEKYNCRGNETVVIGDRTSDYIAGITAGIEHIILVEYGWGYEKHKFPDIRFTINKPLQLIDAVREIDK